MSEQGAKSREGQQMQIWQERTSQQSCLMGIKTVNYGTREMLWWVKVLATETQEQDFESI